MNYDKMNEHFTVVFDVEETEHGFHLKREITVKTLKFIPDYRLFILIKKRLKEVASTDHLEPAHREIFNIALDREVLLLFHDYRTQWKQMFYARNLWKPWKFYQIFKVDRATWRFYSEIKFMSKQLALLESLTYIWPGLTIVASLLNGYFVGSSGYLGVIIYPLMIWSLHAVSCRFQLKRKKPRELGSSGRWQ